MKKIMFNDKYELTKAVLEGRKTITRRAVSMHDYKYGFQLWYDIVSKKYWACDGDESFIVERSRYSKDEVVAIAQSYNKIGLSPSMYCEVPNEYGGTRDGSFDELPGWENKMFVKAELMPHHIKITNIRVERLQDISDEDCLREGIYIDKKGGQSIGYPLAVPFYCTFRGAINRDGKQLYWSTPKDAFAALIDKVSGKGTWESNPMVWVYEFELINSKE